MTTMREFVGSIRNRTDNNVGELTRTDYETDLDVLSFFDNLGRQTSRVDSAGTWTWDYNGDRRIKRLLRRRPRRLHVGAASRGDRGVSAWPACGLRGGRTLRPVSQAFVRCLDRELLLR